MTAVGRSVGMTKEPDAIQSVTALVDPKWRDGIQSPMMTGTGDRVSMAGDIPDGRDDLLLLSFRHWPAAQCVYLNPFVPTLRSFLELSPGRRFPIVQLLGARLLNRPSFVRHRNPADVRCLTCAPLNFSSSQLSRWCRSTDRNRGKHGPTHMSTPNTTGGNSNIHSPANRPPRDMDMLWLSPNTATDHK